MSSTSEIKPHMVTKPIQLLAAWLVGLCVVEASFLTAAASMDGGLRTALGVAAIVYVPLFILAIFVLQTRYRPEMLEDPFYADILRRQNPQTGNLFVAELESEVSTLRGQVTEFQSKTIGLLSEFRSQLADVTRTAGQLAKREIQPEEQVRVFAELQTRVEGSKREIEDARQLLRWSGIRVPINRDLPSYEQIRERLVKEEIPISETFSREPEQFLVTFGAHVPPSNVRMVLTLLRKFGVTSVMYWGESFSHDLYIGSHAYESYATAELDQDLWQSASDPDISDEAFVEAIVARQRRAVNGKNDPLLFAKQLGD